MKIKMLFVSYVFSVGMIKIFCGKQEKERVILKQCSCNIQVYKKVPRLMKKEQYRKNKHTLYCSFVVSFESLA